MSQLTKNAIVNSLEKLLNEKPLNKITIKDITDDCGINRMTFYYHFRDIYDLVERLCAEEAHRIIDEHRAEGDWMKLYILFFQEILKNKTLLMNVYRCISRDEIEKFLRILIDAVIVEVIDSYKESKYLKEEDKKFIVRVYSYPFTGLMMDWVKDEMEDDPVALVNKFFLVISDSIQNTLDKFTHR